MKGAGQWRTQWVHFEIRSADPDATRTFYGKLFGWTFPDGGIPGYSYVETGVPEAVPGGNGQPAFATYEPDAEGRLVVSGLQVLQLASTGGQPLITALVSYRDPAVAIRRGMPAVLP